MTIICGIVENFNNLIPCIKSQTHMEETSLIQASLSIGVSVTIYSQRLFAQMAASSQLCENKRGRDEYLHSGLALRDAKRSNSGLTLGHDSDLMVFLEKINNHCNLEGIHIAVDEAEDEMRLNGVIKPLKDDISLKGQTDNYNIDYGDEKGNTEQMVNSNEQGDGNSEATLVKCDIGFNHYGEASVLDLFVDQFSTDELRIIMNHIDGGYILDIIWYSDALDGYVDTAEAFYGSLWEDDTWQFNGHRRVIQNDFASPGQEEFGVSGAEFNDVWK